MSNTTDPRGPGRQPMRPRPPKPDVPLQPPRQGPFDQDMLNQNDINAKTAEQDAALADVGAHEMSQASTSKVGTLQKVRFGDAAVEHAISVEESTGPWQDASFEQSLERERHKVYPHCYKDDVVHEETKADGKYHRLGNALSRGASKAFKSSSDENKAIKAVLGIIAGVCVAAVLYIVLLFSFGYDEVEAAVIAVVSMVIICVALAFSPFCRCIMTLVFPNFFTGKGRAVLLSITFGVLLSNPIANITHNARETGNSMACIAEIVANQTRALQGEFAQPIKEMAKYINDQKEDLKFLSQSIGGAFKGVSDKLDTLEAAADEAKTILDNEIKVCKSTLEKVHDACKSACDVGIVPIPGCDSLCQTLNQGSSECDKLKDFGKQLTTDTIKTRNELNIAMGYFDVRINASTRFQGNTNTSSNVSEIRAEFDEDIRSKTRNFEHFLSILKKILSLSLLLMFFQSFWYIRNYRAKDGYDNIYITRLFRELDKRGDDKGRESLLPLKEKERKIYVDTSSFLLSAQELIHCKIGLIQVGLHFLLCVVVVVFDYSLYYVLYLVQEHGAIEVGVQGEGRITISVEGHGPVADFYKVLVKGVNIDKMIDKNIDIGNCLPNPSFPATKTIPILLALYFVSFCVVLLRGYGMRLRRFISAYYYEEQEQARIEFLHKKIRHKRIGFLRFLREHIKSSQKEQAVKHKLRLSAMLVARFPFLERCMSSRSRLECVSCEQRERGFNNVKLTRCCGTSGGVPCDAIYCQECWAGLQNSCPLCTEDNVLHRH